MSDALPDHSRRLTDDERARIAFAWAEYRHDYQPSERDIPAAHKGFVAGWTARHLDAEDAS